MFIVYLYTKRSNCNTHSRSQATHLYTSKGAIIFVCICVCFHRLFLFSNVVYSLCSLRYIVRPDGFRISLDNIRSFCLSLSFPLNISFHVAGPRTCHVFDTPPMENNNCNTQIRNMYKIYQTFFLLINIWKTYFISPSAEKDTEAQKHIIVTFYICCSCSSV